MAVGPNQGSIADYGEEHTTGSSGDFLFLSAVRCGQDATNDNQTTNGGVETLALHTASRPPNK